MKKNSTNIGRNSLTGVSTIKRIFVDNYAPSSYKSEAFRLNLGSRLSQLKTGVSEAKNDVTTKQEIINFFGALKDIHSKPVFSSYKGVWLGFHLKKTSEGYFIAWIDEGVAGLQAAKLSVGDKIVSFDGISIQGAIEYVKNNTQYYSTPEFEQSFAEWFLTYRSTSEWAQIPKKDSFVHIQIVPAGSLKPEKVKLKWLDDTKFPPKSRSPFWGKTKMSYLGLLGEIVWRSPKKNPYLTYIFSHGGKNYGYVRFHTYNLKSDSRTIALRELQKSIQAFKKYKINNLVIDQTGNGGGNFIFGFSLLSYLTESPLRTPLQEYIINDRKLVGFASLDYISKDISPFSKIKSNEEAQKIFEKHPIFANDLNFVDRHIKSAKNYFDFFNFFVQEYAEKSGRFLTKPHFQFQEWVYPKNQETYTGSILLIIDELNISAAEYVAATLKDNNRAKLIGRTTSGAGGDQRVVSTENICESYPRGWIFNECISRVEAEGLKRLGLKGFSYTITLGKRVDSSGKVLKPIENIGVVPDIKYEASKKDITSGFSEFKSKILDSLEKL